ncbi:restriction endonuclease subunit S [Fusobacterium polymorphum]|uniref:restriction endonuclease subunit S n=1 Tax=Fusobacterium nucleatum subsp. polymorphum TaxID=76857 RepID=UPI0030CB2D09
MKYIKIKDILEFKKKSKIKASEGLKIGKYNFYTSSKEQNKFLDYYEYSNEALIIGTGGNANIHHSYGKFSVSTDCFVLENKNNKIFLIEYIYKYLLKNIHILENGFRGAGLKHISKEYLENIEIPIISIEKQRKLIKNLKKIDIFIDKNKQIKNELNFFNKSLFTKIFGDIRINNKNWKIKKIGEVVETQYGTSKKASAEFSNGIPILRMNNIRYSGEMDYEDLKYIKLDNNEKEKFLLKKGDLLFNRTNSKELVGKTGLFNLDTPMVFAGYLIRIKPSRQVNSKFLLFFMNSEFMKKVLYNKAKNIVGMANINAKELEDFSIILPPIELQNKFAERVEKIEKLSFEIEKSIKEAENLYNSLINKYFD